MSTTYLTESGRIAPGSDIADVATELYHALVTCRDALGIRDDFLPLGVPSELASTIEKALRLARGS